MMTKEQLHKFNSEYITRYAKILSKGKRKEEMQHNHWRELSAFETGIKCFHLGEEYKSEDGEEEFNSLRKKVKSLFNRDCEQ